VLQWDEEHISYNFDVRKGPISVEYFKGGLTNICYNALDRHVAAGNGNRVCFLWEGNDLDQDRKMTYAEVLEEVCQLVSHLSRPWGWMHALFSLGG
jgi:acetyl-CoA synthetase